LRPNEGLTAEDRLARLPIWRAVPDIEQLTCGRTNVNYLVHCAGEKYFARVAGDLPYHAIVRFHEARCAARAAELGVAPAIVFAGDGMLITRFIDGKTLQQVDPVARATVERIVRLLARTHEGRLPQNMPDVNPVAFSRFYLAQLAQDMLHERDRRRIESILAAAPLGRRIALIHTDLIPENLIDDGDRLWLIDWEYAGLGDPATDLANLAMNFALGVRDRRDAAAIHGGVSFEEAEALRDAVVVREALWCLTQIQAAGYRGDLAAYARLCLARLGIEHAVAQ
jgi:thiamine kinase-like enzyme